jgi:hypothetical protein
VYWRARRGWVVPPGFNTILPEIQVRAGETVAEKVIHSFMIEMVQETICVYEADSSRSSQRAGVIQGHSCVSGDSIRIRESDWVIHSP